MDGVAYWSVWRLDLSLVNFDEREGDLQDSLQHVCPCEC